MDEPRGDPSVPMEEGEAFGSVLPNCFARYLVEDNARTFFLPSVSTPSALKYTFNPRSQCRKTFMRLPNKAIGQSQIMDSQVASILGVSFEPSNNISAEVPYKGDHPKNETPFNANTSLQVEPEEQFYLGSELLHHITEFTPPPTYTEYDGNEHKTNNSINSPNELHLHQQRPFVPSYRAVGGRPRHTEEAKRRVRVVGLRIENYQGSISKFELQNIQLRESENCCLFLIHVHPAVMNDLNELFRLINHGRIFSFHVNPPELESGNLSCAAKLCFMTRDSAVRFRQQAISSQGIRIRGMRIRCYWNREKSRPTAAVAEKTRVVCFAGPDLSLHYLEFILRANMFYVLVTWRFWTNFGMHGPETVVEMHFASVRGQSQMAMACFNSYFDGNPQYRAWYAPDPCGP